MVNKVILIGNVGKDPEIKTVGETKLATFSLATSKTYNDKSGNKQQQTEWHNIEVWGNMAEVISKHVKKGSQLFVEGEIKTNSYEKDGEKKYRTSIRCNYFSFVGKKAETEQADGSDPY